MTRLRGPTAPLRFAGAFALACACVALGACAPPNRELQAGRYRAVVDSAGGDLPFALQVTRDASGYGLSIVEGDLSLPATGVRVHEGKVTAVLPGGRSTLEGTVADGALRGEIALVAPDGSSHPIPFKAILGQAWRFHEQPATDNFEAAGRWNVTFIDDRGAQVSGVAEFEQRFEQVAGIVRTAAGEWRFTGEVHGDDLLLSRFDGQSGALWLARLNKQGDLDGELWSLPTIHQRLVATRISPTAP